MARNIVPPRWKKGESGNPKGRPKKIALQLKREGYSLWEINDTIQQMVSLELDDLKEIYQNPKATILEKTIAAALKKGLQKGDLNSIETLLNRVYGKPKEKMDITTDGEAINKNQYEIKIITSDKNQTNE